MHAVSCVMLSVVLFSCAGAAGGPGWPPDLSWIEHSESVAIERGEAYARFTLASRIEAERSRVVTSDAVVLGTVTALRSYRPERGGIRTAITVQAHEWLKGPGETDEVVMAMTGGTIDGVSMVVRGSDPPEIGATFVVYLRSDPDQPGSFLGGYRDTRFDVTADGFVPAKGMALEPFLEVLREHLTPRTTEDLYRLSDAVVLGEVVEYRFVHREPPEVSGVPDSHNFLTLSVEEVGKGQETQSGLITVSLPPKVTNYPDVPELEAGERVVLFLGESADGRRSLVGGADAALLVREDGGFGSYTSLDELRAAAENTAPSHSEQPTED